MFYYQKHWKEPLLRIEDWSIAFTSREENGSDQSGLIKGGGENGPQLGTEWPKYNKLLFQVQGTLLEGAMRENWLSLVGEILISLLYRLIIDPMAFHS